MTDTKNNEEVQEEFQKRFNKWNSGECNGSPSCCKDCTKEDTTTKEGAWDQKKWDEQQSKRDGEIRVVVPSIFRVSLDKIKNLLKRRKKNGNE